MNPAADAVLGHVLNGLLLAGILALIGILIALSRWTKALYDAHLGPGSRDEDGQLRWYVREAQITAAMADVVAAVRDEAEKTRNVLVSHTVALNALLEEIRIDRAVRKRIAQELDSET